MMVGTVIGFDWDHNECRENLAEPRMSCTA